MVCNLTRRTRPFLLIAMPQAVRAAFGVGPEELEGTVTLGGRVFDWLRIYPETSGFSSAEQDPEVKGIVAGFSGFTARVYQPWGDASVDVEAHLSAAAYLALAKVQEIAATTGSAVTIRDYCTPNLDAIAVAIASNTPLAYTQRLCDLRITNRPPLFGTANRYRLKETVKFRLRFVG